MDPRKQHSWSCVRPGPGGGRRWFFCALVGAQSRQCVQRLLQPDEAGLGAFPRPMDTNGLPRGGSAARFGVARARPFDGRSGLWCPLGGLFQACRSVAGSAFDFAAPCPLAAAKRCRHVSTCLCSGPWREQPVDGDDSSGRPNAGVWALAPISASHCAGRPAPFAPNRRCRTVVRAIGERGAALLDRSGRGACGRGVNSGPLPMQGLFP